VNAYAMYNLDSPGSSGIRGEVDVLLRTGISSDRIPSWTGSRLGWGRSDLDPGFLRHTVDSIHMRAF
jgi:hypothetical protein